jgi:PPK2 family polyphosphate:nucleotide phosphotransferase
MKLHKDVIEELTVHPGDAASLRHRSTNATRTDWLGPPSTSTPRHLAEQELEAFREELRAAQEVLYASDQYALLVIFQALDAAGKDGTINHVMSGVNPQGCEVVSFKSPSTDELAHDFLWRCAKVLPARGRIGIFNRSYYEEVLVARVHPEILAAQRLPPESGSDEKLWQRRFEDINGFEHHLVRNGTRIVKFFLHVSEEEQKRRLLERLDDPAKYWKFSNADLKERPFRREYLQAYEAALTATSTSWAPWYVVPADHKYELRALVGGILVNVIEHMDLRLPHISRAERAVLAAAKQALLDD